MFMLQKICLGERLLEESFLTQFHFLGISLLGKESIMSF